MAINLRPELGIRVRRTGRSQPAQPFQNKVISSVPEPAGPDTSWVSLEPIEDHGGVTQPGFSGRQSIHGPVVSGQAEEIGLDDTDLRSNQRSIAAHLDDSYYIRDLVPRLFTVDANATLVQIPAASPQWPAVKMPDGVISIVVASWRKPRLWVSGRIRLQIRYTSDVGSTASFNVRYRLLAIRRGEVLPGTLLSANPATFTLAGPTVANTEMVDDYRYSTVSFDSDDERLSLQIFRDGTADANANALFLSSVEVVHIPAQQQVHV